MECDKCTNMSGKWNTAEHRAQVVVTVPENATCEVYDEYINREKQHVVLMKISYRFIKATDNEGAFVQITQTLGQDKIMATRAQGIQGPVCWQ